MCNGCMPVRAVCKPDARGCSLWRSLLARLPRRNPRFETRSEQERVVVVWTLPGLLHMVTLEYKGLCLPLMLRQFTRHTSVVQCGSDTATEADCGQSSQCLCSYQSCHACFWSSSPRCFSKDTSLHLVWIHIAKIRQNTSPWLMTKGYVLVA